MLKGPSNSVPARTSSETFWNFGSVYYRSSSIYKCINIAPNFQCSKYVASGFDLVPSSYTVVPIFGIHTILLFLQDVLVGEMRCYRCIQLKLFLDTKRPRFSNRTSDLIKKAQGKKLRVFVRDQDQLHSSHNYTSYLTLVNKLWGIYHVSTNYCPMWTYYFRSLKGGLECFCFTKFYKIEGLDMNIGRLGTLKVIFLEA